MSEAITRLDAPPVPELPGAAATEPAVFMFGYERSGTTLLSMIVGAHPGIAVPLTVTGLWYRYAARLADYDHLENVQALERLVDDLLLEERIQLWDEEIPREEVLTGLAPGSYPAVVRRFHEVYARRKGKARWANLDIATLTAMDTANDWFPEARFVHIVRDPRDVALSHETMPYSSGNTLDCAVRWQERLSTNLKMGRILGSERYHVLRYEDLIGDTERTLTQLCEFIGVAYDPRMLDYPQMVDEKVPRHRRWLWPALDTPPDVSKMGQWRTRMGPAKRFVVESNAEPTIRALGYPLEGRPGSALPGHLFEFYCFLDRGSRFRRLARRFGIQRQSKLERSWQRKARDEAGGYRGAQQSAFGSLVNQGVYGTGFRHGDTARAFFESAMDAVIKEHRPAPAAPLRVLDCGCGPGAWMEALDEASAQRDWPELEQYGFDLTPEMVDVARRRLRNRLPPERLEAGDIADPAAYRFPGATEGFDIIFAYDVVQQLPVKMQFDAVETMAGALTDSGALVVFDHDSASAYGRKMGRKKLLTRYLGVSLVPRYYLNAAYPPLRRFAEKLEGKGFQVLLKHDDLERKFCLIVRRSAGAATGP